MTNTQVRLMASAIVLLAGGIMANSAHLDTNVSLAIIVISAALFVAEYWRCQKS
jgi:hypothetical protein